MSQRSIYLREQAAKCEWHAQNMGDSETQVRLRKLAAEYLAEADDIESTESGGPDGRADERISRPYAGGFSSLEKTYR